MALIELTFWICAFLIFHTYIGYPILLLTISIFASRRRRRDEDLLPSVSMLISAYN